MIAEEVKARIIERYKTTKLSLRQVAKEFNTSAPTVRSILVKAGVPITGSQFFSKDGKQKRGYHQPSAIAKVLAGKLDGKSTKDLASETGLAVSAVRKILNEGEIEQCVRQSKSRVACMLEKALDVVDFHLDLNDKGVAMQIVQGSGVLRLTDGGDEGNKLGTGVTINLALFDAGRAKSLLASLAGDKSAVVLDENLREDQGRAGLPESVQTVS